MRDNLISKLELAAAANATEKPVDRTRVRAAVAELVEALRETGFNTIAVQEAQFSISSLPGAMVTLNGVDEYMMLGSDEAFVGDTEIRAEVVEELGNAVFEFQVSEEGMRYARATGAAFASIARRAERRMFERRRPNGLGRKGRGEAVAS